MLFGEGPQIKNIAADLNKLFRQGSLLNQSAQTVEGDSTADQGTSDLLAARDPVIQEISVGMSGEQSARYTVSGTPPLSLPNSLGKPLKAWNVALSPYQDLHGYDNPWPAGGGVNKVDNDNLLVGYISNDNGQFSHANGSRATDFISVTAGESYRIVTEQTSGMWGAWYDESKVYISGITNYTVAPVITAPANAKYVRLTVSFSKSNPHPEYFALNYPSTVTTWSPYSNICPILGTDKLNVFVEESYDPAATPKVVIVTPETIYGGTYDAVSGAGTIDRASVDLGTLGWEYSTGYFKTSGLNGIIKRPARNTDVPSDLSSCYKVTYWDDTADQCITVRPARISVSGPDVWIKDTQYTDASTFTIAMSGLELVYELSTPIPFTTDGHTITLHKGTPTTWATAEDGTVESMEVTYVGKA